MLRLIVLAAAVLFFPSSNAQILKSLPMEASSPREDLRKRIFTKDLAKRDCQVISSDPAAAVAIDAALERTVKKIIAAIEKQNEKTLRDTFHPRLKVKVGQVQSSLASLQQIVGGKYSVTNYRVAALNSPDGSTDAIECVDNGVLMHPLYGYPLVAGVWLQVMGESEVARIFFELVPTASDWLIGAWHIQQWTHAGKDFAMWYEIAQAEAAKKRPAGSYIAADIASKLLDGGGFLVFPVKHDADSWRDKQMSTATWEKTIRDTFPSDKIIYTATLFAKGGAGVLIRFGITEEMSANAIKAHCQERFKKALSAEWSEVIAGIRCGYNFARENPKNDGVMGGMYVSKENLSDSATKPK